MHLRLGWVHRQADLLPPPLRLDLQRCLYQTVFLLRLRPHGDGQGGVLLFAALHCSGQAV